MCYHHYNQTPLTPYRLCGYPPFPQSEEYKALQLIVKGEYYFHEDKWKDVSEDAKNFIRALLVTNPAKRCTAKQVPFFAVVENRRVR